MQKNKIAPTHTIGCYIVSPVCPWFTNLGYKQPRGRGWREPGAQEDSCEGPKLGSQHPIRQLSWTRKYSSGSFQSHNALFWPQGTCPHTCASHTHTHTHTTHTHTIHTHTHTHTHTITNKINTKACFVEMYMCWTYRGICLVLRQYNVLSL
jgi:hypothetical protein